MRERGKLKTNNAQRRDARKYKAPRKYLVSSTSWRIEQCSVDLGLNVPKPRLSFKDRLMAELEAKGKLSA